MRKLVIAACALAAALGGYGVSQAQTLQAAPDPNTAFAVSVVLPDKTVRVVYADALPAVGDTLRLNKYTVVVVRRVDWSVDGSSVARPVSVATSY